MTSPDSTSALRDFMRVVREKVVGLSEEVRAAKAENERMAAALVELREAQALVRSAPGEQELRRMVEEAVRAIEIPAGPPGPAGPQGEPGPQGERGEDGIATTEELEALVEERFREVQARTFADSYRGVFSAGESYTRGEFTTFDGCLWLAVDNTEAKPGKGGEDATGWRLVAKRGRDGRDRT